MIPWFKGTRRIQQYAESGDFIILEVTNNMGKLFKVIQKDGGEDYKARFSGSLKKCADWANEHGANFKIFGCYESFNITTKRTCLNCRWHITPDYCQMHQTRLNGESTPCNLHESEV